MPFLWINGVSAPTRRVLRAMGGGWAQRAVCAKLVMPERVKSHQTYMSLTDVCLLSISKQCCEKGTRESREETWGRRVIGGPAQREKHN